MNTKESIREAYNRVSKDYAAAFWNELERKPFDRMILEWFAAHIPHGEKVLEIGCGPGEVSGFLTASGAKCIATDLSAGMIENGKVIFPQVQFDVQDFFQLTYADGSFYGAVGFFAIVNLTMAEVEAVLSEVERVLKPGGLFLFSFHIFEGENKIQVNEFLNQEIEPLTFYFFEVDEIKALTERCGFHVLDVLIRYPYRDVEYPSKRAYFVVNKPLAS